MNRPKHGQSFVPLSPLKESLFCSGQGRDLGLDWDWDGTGPKPERWIPTETILEAKEKPKGSLEVDVLFFILQHRSVRIGKNWEILSYQEPRATKSLLLRFLFWLS